MNPKTIRMLNEVRLAHRRIGTSSLSLVEKEDAESLFRQIILKAKSLPSGSTLPKGEVRLRKLCQEFLDRYEKGVEA